MSDIGWFREHIFLIHPLVAKSNGNKGIQKIFSPIVVDTIVLYQLGVKREKCACKFNLYLTLIAHPFAANCIQIS